MHRPRTTAPADHRPPSAGAAAADRRPSPAAVCRPLRTTALALTAVYLLFLAWLALRPLPVSWTYPANLTPFASVRQALAVGGFAGLRQVASALLPVAPLGALLGLADGRLRAAWLPSLLRSAGGAALLATALEILKSWAPGHVSNVDDILLGTLGAALCHLAVVPTVRTLLRRTPTPPRPLPRPEAATHPRPSLDASMT